LDFYSHASTIFWKCPKNLHWGGCVRINILVTSAPLNE
jgi:hypothetical protein